MTLLISLSGRLDTISAPAFLDMYRNTAAEHKIETVTIDMKDLKYISSAGLRALLIIRKERSSKNEFSLINFNNEIMEILNTTGFEGILC